jgi:hypothetical protein
MEGRLSQLCEVVTRFDNPYEPAKPVVRCRHSEAFVPNGRFQSSVCVRRCDTLDAATSLENPLILILADNERPGGNFRALAGMQEESLFLRSALHRHLLPEMYPIGLDEGLYAPDVPLVTGGVASFIACPGLKMPRLIDEKLCTNDRHVLTKKIELIVQVAGQYGHSDLVLGAEFGAVFHMRSQRSLQMFFVLTVDHIARLTSPCLVQTTTRLTRCLGAKPSPEETREIRVTTRLVEGWGCILGAGEGRW